MTNGSKVDDRGWIFLESLFSKELLPLCTPHNALMEVLCGELINWSKHLSRSPNMTHNSRGCFGTAGAAPSRWARRLSNELQKRPKAHPHRGRAGPRVIEWVLERRAEKCWVTVKVNKIKAGNLRASVLHKRCRQQQRGGSAGVKRQGWMRGL